MKAAEEAGKQEEGKPKKKKKAAPRSRIDFVLTRDDERRVFVEVKSVTLAEPCARPLLWGVLESRASHSGPH